MRRAGTLTWTTLLAGLAIGLLAPAAHAKSEYVAYIPNGNVSTCNSCHPNGNTGALTIFGEDALAQMGKPSTQWWPAMQALDSDQDGQTNAQELGDPCQEWLIGLDPGRTTAISNPGDPASKSATPDVPSCGGGGAGGGTTTTSGTGQGGAGAAGGGTTTMMNGVGAGPGSGEGAGAPFSTGAGKADPPVTIQGSCSTAPARTSDGTLVLFASIALYLIARSRRTAHR